MDPASVNWLAVIAAAVSMFLLGGVWYSPVLFARAWMQDCGFSEQELEKSFNPARIFGGSFVLALVASTNLAFFLGPKADLSFGIFAGAATGIGWVAAAFGITYLFERRPLRLFLINAGYHAVAFTIMGAIIGVWR
jgi:hypothetical protein